MSRRLENHLYPKGSLSDPTITPSVLDSDGVAVTYTSSKRKTTEATVVDVGDSANSNTGDPLRTAFVKINNFIEASYWTNESVARDMDEFERRLDSDAIIIADHTKRLDSDEATLQYLQTQVDILIAENDSDESQLQTLQTQIDRHEQRLDSDELAIQFLQKQADRFEQRLDSDEAAISSLSSEVFTNVALIIYDSTGGALKTIYGRST